MRTAGRITGRVEEMPVNATAGQETTREIWLLRLRVGVLEKLVAELIRGPEQAPGNQSADPGT